MRLCVGLTGGIGCGKTTVATLFAEHGAAIIDTDAIAHQLTQPGGRAIASIREIFGQDFITATGALDRAKMRNLIFSDSSCKFQLERLLHPLILEQTHSLLAQQQSNPYTILVVPLLPETPDFRKLVQRVLVVDCQEQNQLKRVMLRTGMTKPEVLAIIAHQTPRSERLQIANDVIHNDATEIELRTQVEKLHDQYLNIRNRI